MSFKRFQYLLLFIYAGNQSTNEAQLISLQQFDYMAVVTSFGYLKHRVVHGLYGCAVSDGGIRIRVPLEPQPLS